jgi:hypothetical protein
VETALAKVRAAFLRGRGLLQSWMRAGQGDKGGHFCIVVGNGCREEFGDLVATSAARLEMGKVFGDRFGIGSSSQFSNSYTVSNKSLVSSHPGIEFPQGLLEMGRDIIVKEVAVFTEDEVLE